MHTLLLLLTLLCSSSLLAQHIQQFTPYDDAFQGIIKSYKPSFDASYPDWAKELYVFPANAETVRIGLNTYLQQNHNAHRAIIR